MGGFAFKQKYGVEGIRLSRDDYFELQNLIFDKVFRDYPEKERALWDIRTVQTKESFGDMDLLSVIPADVVFSPEYYKDVSHNGDVTSFLLNDFLGKKFKNFQVDIVECKNWADLKSRHFFYQFGVFGNILGRIANHIDKNLHFGHEGFKYTYNGLNGSQFYGNIYLEKCDTEESQERFLNFMGLPKVVPNFENFEQVYEFISQSRFFTKSAFSFEVMNHENRTRNRKRPDYTAFLEWLKVAEIDNEPIYKFSLDQNGLAKFLNHSFPNSDFIRQLTEFKNRESIDIVVKTKFNGEYVSNITGYKNKELGYFIKFFKDENPFWKSEILIKSQKEIDDMVLASLASYKYGLN